MCADRPITGYQRGSSGLQSGRDCAIRMTVASALMLALVVTVSRPANAAASTGGGATPGSCWEQAAQRHQVNPHLLVAIAEVESGLRARAIGRNTNGSIDIGLMQINTLWLPELGRYGVSAKDLLDPCVSVHVGAWVLAQKMRRHGNTWTAVGAYNAGSDGLRERYARKVARVLLMRRAFESPASAAAVSENAATPADERLQ